MAGYLIEERRRWPVITASPRGQCSKKIQNLEGKAYSDEGKPCQSPGRMKNSSYYIAPVGVRTHDLPHTVASNMGKVSHNLTHSATAAVLQFSLTGLSPLIKTISLPCVLGYNSKPLQSTWSRYSTI